MMRYSALGSLYSKRRKAGGEAVGAFNIAIAQGYRILKYVAK